MNTYYFILLLSFTLVSCDSNNVQVKNADVFPLEANKAGQDDFRVYSTPKSSKLIIVFKSDVAGQAKISLYQEDGKMLGTKFYYVNKGSNTWEYSYSFRSPGIYIVKLIMNKIERVTKVYKSGP